LHFTDWKLEFSKRLFQGHTGKSVSTLGLEVRSSGFQLHKITLPFKKNYFSNNKSHYRKEWSSVFVFSLQKYKEWSALVLPAFGLPSCFLNTANAP